MSNQLLASKTVVLEEPPRIRSITALPTAVLAMVGVTQRGVVGVAKLFTSFETWRNTYGAATTDSLEAFAAVQAYFEEGGSFLWFTRTAHYTDITSAATLTALFATITLQTDAATAAEIIGSIAGPYNLEPADSIGIAVDGGGVSTPTLTATVGSAISVADAGGFDTTGGTSDLTITIDGGTAQVVSLTSGGTQSAQAIVDDINPNITGGFAQVTADAVEIFSDTRGSGSSVAVVNGTTDADLAFTPTAGTGNVANIDAVTQAELKTIIEAAVAGLTVDISTPATPTLRSNTTGVTSQLDTSGATAISTALGWANPTTENGTAGVPVDTLILTGKYRGAYGNAIGFEVKAPTNGDVGHFNLDVIDNTFVVETFANLNTDPLSPNFVETVINAATGSELVSAADQGLGAGNAPTLGVTALMTGGNDGLTSIADSDFIGSSASDTGIRSFDIVSGITLLAIPGRATNAVANAMIQYAEVTRSLSIFCVLDPPAALNTAAIIAYIEGAPALLGSSEHGAIYWPRVKIINPNKDVFGPADDITVPNSGHVCGVYARTDASRPGGVYIAPAGIENGLLRTITGLEDDPDGLDRHQVFKEENRDLIYPKRINPIDDEGGLLNLDGTKTLKGNGNFPGVAERRGVIFIEQSIKTGVQFAKHKNHTAELRREVDRTIELFLINQMRVGAFRTKDPVTAFFIDVDEGLNTPAVVFSNQLIARIGLATNKTVDFIILKFTQDTRALEQELAQG